MAVCRNCGKDSKDWGNRPCYLSPGGEHLAKPEPAAPKDKPTTLLDRVAAAIYQGNQEDEWLPTADGSPNRASYEYARRALKALDQDPDQA